MLPLLGVLFLNHLLELVRSLAQLREGLLYGIGFLSAFLSGAEIGFFRSVFLKTTAMASIVRRVCAPMLLAKVVVFLGMSFPRDSGTLPVPGRYVHFLSLCEGFSSQEATDLLDLSWLNTRSVASRDRRSERMSTGVPPFL